jgi:hypothetical protein
VVDLSTLPIDTPSRAVDDLSSVRTEDQMAYTGISAFSLVLVLLFANDVSLAATVVGDGAIDERRLRGPSLLFGFFAFVIRITILATRTAAPAAKTATVISDDGGILWLDGLN